MRKYKGKYRRREKHRHNCKYCDRSFLGAKNKVYCSKECSYKKNLERVKEKYIPQLNFIRRKIKCKLCNKEFMKKTTSNIYCSKECSKEMHREKYKKISLGIIDSSEEDNNAICFLKLRFEIFKRDNFICQYCGRSPKKDKCKLVIDHVFPRSKGGEFIPSNLITSCFECNLGKRDRVLEERQLNKLEVQYD